MKTFITLSTILWLHFGAVRMNLQFCVVSWLWVLRYVLLLADVVTSSFFGKFLSVRFGFSLLLVGRDFRSLDSVLEPIECNPRRSLSA